MLSEFIQKVKSLYKEKHTDFYVATLIFLIGMASFGLGRLSILWPSKEPIRIEENQSSNTAFINSINRSENPIKKSELTTRPKGKYVASKSGTSYHYPWCQGALKIKEENKIWFQTKEEATKAGYKPAGNCEGL